MPATTRIDRSAGENRILHNLPAYLTSFIGREREIAEVRRLLLQARLLTLTGAGGCGKTRLALQVATSLLEEHPEGVWLIELAALTNGRLVPQAIASVLQVREQRKRSLAQTVQTYLVDKRLLLVLDTCEHLVEACASLVDDLLRGCPHLRVLTTSREALGIPGEVTWRVPSLSLPDPTQPTRLETVAQCEAVRLFTDRATSHRPGFALTNQNALAVAQLCSRLDGMPLAIELAAAVVGVLSPQEILDRLEDRFRLLTGGSRTAMARQRTLQATVDWSYGLLAEREKILFRRLGVFAGTFGLKSAEAVCASDGLQAQDILPLLSRLVEESLVVAEPTSGGARYRLLDTVRQYAQDRLIESNEARPTYRRHAAYFLALAETSAAQLKGPQRPLWLEHLEAEHDNMRTALKWSAEDPDTRLRLGAALAPFWEAGGYLTEGQQWLSEALDACPDASSSRARALAGAAGLAIRRAEYGAARRHLQASLDLSERLSDRAGVGQALISLGELGIIQQDDDAARQYLEASLVLHRELDDQGGIAMTLMFLGRLATWGGDFAAGQSLLESGLEISRTQKDLTGVAMTLVFLGDRAMRVKDFGQAHAHLGESLAVSFELGDRWITAIVLQHFAGLAALQSHEERAMRLAGAAAALHDTIGGATPLRGRTLLAEWLERPRRALGPKAAAFHAEGRKMPLVDAVAYALRQPAPLGRREDQAGPEFLTHREHQIANLVADGLTNRRIAQRLVIAPRTVDTHVEHILGKLGFHTRAQIAAWATERRHQPVS